MSVRKYPTYLVESYAPARTTCDEAAACARAAAEMSSDDVPVRYVRSVFVPEDETCFHVFEAPSAEALGQASQRAGLEFHRIVEAVAT